MYIISLVIFYTTQIDDEVKTVVLSRHENLSKVNFFARSAIREHILFHSRLIASRVTACQKQSVELEKGIGMCHVYRNANNITAAVITDKEYPARVAFLLIEKTLELFEKKFPINTLSRHDTDLSREFPEGDALLNKFQNPAEADELTRIQNDLKEVHEIMYTTMDKLLQRGENLETLMSKTKDLSAASERFYRQAKSQNQCCKLY